MNKTLFVVIITILAVHINAQTIEECQRLAVENYPLIRQYSLLDKTSELTLSKIKRGWLPQVNFSAQASYQSDVTAFPEAIQTVYQQLGIDMQGLRKDQYRIALDVNQVLYDGGVMKRSKEVAKAEYDVEKSTEDVSLYAIKQRVNELYFSILLTEEQIILEEDLSETLLTNERKLESMVRNGTASQSDLDNIRVERLTTMQRLNADRSALNTLYSIISVLCGSDIKQLDKSSLSTMINNDGLRPELKAIDAQLRLLETKRKLVGTEITPRISLFATGFYGYPGYNLFEDMMSRKWSLNGIVGARLTWNIGALYNRKLELNLIDLQKQKAENNRAIFMFNNDIEQTRHNESIERYKAMISSDDEIIELRSSIRKATESKLDNGVIDITDLLREISNETAARQQRATHQILMFKEIYDLKLTKGE